MRFDQRRLLEAGMVVDIADHSLPKFHLEELAQKYSGRLIGRYIQNYKEKADRGDPLEEKAFSYGLEALLTADRGKEEGT